MRRFACALSLHLTQPLLERSCCAGLFLATLISPAWAGSVIYSYDTLGRVSQAA